MICWKLMHFPVNLQNETLMSLPEDLRLVSARAIAKIAIENNHAAGGIMSKIELLCVCQIDLFERCDA
jgi:hypothetical protein